MRAGSQPGSLRSPKRVLPTEQQDRGADARRCGQRCPGAFPRPRPCASTGVGLTAAGIGLEPRRQRGKSLLQSISAPQSRSAPLVVKAVEATDPLRPVCRRCRSAEDASPPPGSMALPRGSAKAAGPQSSRAAGIPSGNKLAKGWFPVHPEIPPRQNVHGRVPSANVCALMGTELPLAPQPCSLRKTRQGLGMTSYRLPGNVLPDEGGRGSIKTAQCMYLSPCVNISVAAETS